MLSRLGPAAIPPPCDIWHSAHWAKRCRPRKYKALAEPEPKWISIVGSICESSGTYFLRNASNSSACLLVIRSRTDKIVVAWPSVIIPSMRPTTRASWCTLSLSICLPSSDCSNSRNNCPLFWRNSSKNLISFDTQSFKSAICSSVKISCTSFATTPRCTLCPDSILKLTKPKCWLGFPTVSKSLSSGVPVTHVRRREVKFQNSWLEVLSIPLRSDFSSRGNLNFPDLPLRYLNRISRISSICDLDKVVAISPRPMASTLPSSASCSL